MTQAQERFENTALVEAWLKEPTFLEPVDEERVAAIVHHTPQVRRWPPQVDLGRFAPMLNATKFAAASVVLALVGGLLFTALPSGPVPDGAPAAITATEPAATEPTAVTPTAEATPELATDRTVNADSDMPFITLPDELPVGAESGTIDTSAGPIEWVRVTGEEGTLPSGWSQLLPWDDGILAWNGYFGQLHTSDDGVTWTAVETEDLHGEMAAVGDELLNVQPSSHRPHRSSPGGARVVRTNELGGEWTELDITALEDAKLSGWHVGDDAYVVLAPQMIDERLVFGVHYSYSLPKKELGISTSGTKNLRALPDGRYVLCSSGDSADCSADARWVLRIKETPEGLVLRHDKTGKRLGLLEGATADQIYRGEGGSYRRLFAIEGDEVVEIDSPWPGLSPWQATNRTVAPQGSVPVLREWQFDGRADRSLLGLPSFASEVPQRGGLRVVRSPDRLLGIVWGKRGETIGAWESMDGIDWKPAPAGAPDGELTWNGASWMSSSQGPDGWDHWIHVGGEWVSLGEIGRNVDQPFGIGNVLLLRPWSEPEQQHLFVLALPVHE